MTIGRRQTGYSYLYWLYAVPALCITSLTGTSHAASGADAQVAGLTDRYYEEYLALNPLTATYIGDARYNDRLAIDIAPNQVAAVANLHRKYLQAAERIDAVALSPAEQLTLAVLKYECVTAIEAAKFPQWLLPIDQWSNLALTLPELGSGESAQPFVTEIDYDNFLGRMRDFNAWSKQAVENMRAGMRQGVIQPRALMLKSLPQLQAQIVDDPKASLFYQPIAKLPASLSAKTRQRLEKAYEQAIQTQIVPAYRRLHDFIRDEYLPRTRTSVARTALPNGGEWYRQAIRRSTTTSLTADEIHSLGLKEVARIRDEMQGVQARLRIPGTLQQFFKSLENDPKQYFASADELLDAHRALKIKVDAKLPALFDRFPQADYQIRPVEAFRERSAAGASYQQPSAEGSRPGIFYINTYNLKAQPKYAITTLSLHEASPGHHFQISMQQEIEGLPRFRRFLVGYTAYVEGWALYAESLGRELNLFDDPYQYFGHLNDEMLRAMRLVVDTGLHAKGWTRERAIAYLLENSAMAESDAEAEVERYIADPGQALGYKLGQLRIRELRRNATEALGERFDIKEFHAQILRDGPLPLDLLSAKIERWIATQK